MKFLKTTLLITLISLFTFSCTKDESSDAGENQAKIIGKWLLTGETENGIALEIDECASILTFTNTQLMSTYYYGENCEESEVYNQEYTIDESTISVIEDGETYSASIVRLTSATLIIKDSYEEEDGETYEYTETYTKQ